MDEDLTIINSNTRKEKIKNFLVTNKKIISYFLTFILILIFIFFGYQSYSKSKIKNISDEYNSAIIEYSQSNKDKTKNILVNIVNKNNIWQIGKYIGNDEFLNKGIAKQMTINFINFFQINFPENKEIYSITKSSNKINIIVNQKIGFEIDSKINSEFVLMKKIL